MNTPWTAHRRFDVSCVVEVSHCFESLGAHVTVDGEQTIQPGDKVLVHGAPIHVRYGEVVTERRTATITRAPWWEQWWIRATGDIDCLELIDVSFTDRRRL